MLKTAVLLFLLLLSACRAHSSLEQDYLMKTDGCPSQQLKVMTFNIHLARDSKGQDTQAPLASFLQDRGSDVVFLQELDQGTRRSSGRDQLAMLQEASHYPFGHFAPLIDWDGGKYGIGMLSRYPLLDLMQISLDVPAAQQGPEYEKRGALYARIEVGQQSIHLLNTHLHYEPLARNSQWQLLKQFLDTKLKKDDRLVLAGDFNARPVSTLIRDISEDFQNTWELIAPFADVRYIDYIFTKNFAPPCRYERSGGQFSDHEAYSVVLPLGG